MISEDMGFSTPAAFFEMTKLDAVSTESVSLKDNQNIHVTENGEVLLK